MTFWPVLSLPIVSAVSGPAHGDNVLRPLKQPVQQIPASYIKRAVELAEISVKRHEGTGYGAVIVKNGLIVGEGRNRTYLLKDPTAHSEVDAIRDACRRLNSGTLSGCDIYCSAHPCTMCQSACSWAQLDHIFVGQANLEAIEVKPSYAKC